MHARTLPIALGVCAISLAAQLAAQRMPTREPSAVAAAQAGLSALGGSPATICADGTDMRWHPDGASSNYPIHVCASAAQSRVDIVLPGGTSRRVVAGGKGIIALPSGQIRALADRNTAYEEPLYFPGLTLADLLADPSRSALDKGTATVAGETRRELDFPSVAPFGPRALDMRGPSTIRVFLDATGALAAVAFEQAGEQPNSPEFAGLITYSDFESVGGYRVAATVEERDFDDAEITGTSRVAFALHFNSFQINPALPPGYFSLTSGGAQ